MSRPILNGFNATIKHRHMTESVNIVSGVQAYEVKATYEYHTTASIVKLSQNDGAVTYNVISSKGSWKLMRYFQQQKTRQGNHPRSTRKSQNVVPRQTTSPFKRTLEMEKRPTWRVDHPGQRPSTQFTQSDHDITNKALDWFRLDDWFPLLALAFILTFIGERMAGSDHIVRTRTRWFAAFGFLLYTGFGIHVCGLSNPYTVVLITLRALLASAMAYGIGLILFSIVNALAIFKRLVALMNWFWKLSKLLPRMPKKKPVKIILPPPAPRPAPPTAEERTEKARLRYQKRLQLIEKANLDPTEESAAKAKAKQTYLKEIDEVIS
jgi:hypothetical protein